MGNVWGATVGGGGGGSAGVGVREVGENDLKTLGRVHIQRLIFDQSWPWNYLGC